ncbi:hypothetical protein FQA39_LY01051 [Lamprigera yunnana]|nr:hypothetical protein FQA39_LY01051 [Lamprigera yunnana]
MLRVLEKWNSNQQVHCDIIYSFEVNGSSVTVEEKDGLFDIKARANIPVLVSPEEFSCELRIPKANYTQSDPSLGHNNQQHPRFFVVVRKSSTSRSLLVSLSQNVELSVATELWRLPEMVLYSCLPLGLVNLVPPVSCEILQIDSALLSIREDNILNYYNHKYYSSMECVTWVAGLMSSGVFRNNFFKRRFPSIHLFLVYPLLGDLGYRVSE